LLRKRFLRWHFPRRGHAKQQALLCAARLQCWSRFAALESALARGEIEHAGRLIATVAADAALQDWLGVVTEESRLRLIRAGRQDCYEQEDTGEEGFHETRSPGQGDFHVPHRPSAVDLDQASDTDLLANRRGCVPGARLPSGLALGGRGLPAVLDVPEPKSLV